MSEWIDIWREDVGYEKEDDQDDAKGQNMFYPVREFLFDKTNFVKIKFSDEFYEGKMNDVRNIPNFPYAPQCSSQCSYCPLASRPLRAQAEA